MLNCVAAYCLLLVHGFLMNVNLIDTCDLKLGFYICTCLKRVTLGLLICLPCKYSGMVVSVSVSFTQPQGGDKSQDITLSVFQVSSGSDSLRKLEDSSHWTVLKTTQSEKELHLNFSIPYTSMI